MTNAVGAGIFGSLKKRVRNEIRELIESNATLRRNQYPLYHRIFRYLFVDRTIIQFLAAYAVLLLLVCIAEWGINRNLPDTLPGYGTVRLREFLTNVGSYLIAAQVGMLAIVTVAVGVVTILSERGDESSINTDIRLYYSESRSYEVAVSGTALLLVLVLQLFWPVQHVMHVFDMGGPDLSFKLLLTVAHALWFSINLILFLQFITSTLSFVEPSSRERLREKYCSNIIIPRDLEQRLLSVLYQNAPSELFGNQPLKEGPRVWFGHSEDRLESKEEITREVSHGLILTDVKLRPLTWLLRRWISKTRVIETPVRGFGGEYWNSSISTPVMFGITYDRSITLVRTKGGPKLSAWEKILYRACFSLKRERIREIDLPVPEDFLGQLVQTLIRQTERSSTTGFRSALDEAIKFHRFILDAQNTRDQTGEYFNLAEVGGMFSSPDLDLIRQYHRVYSAAVAQLDSDTFYIDRLSNLPVRLLPNDLMNFSVKVVKRLMHLGPIELNELEAWYSKNSSIDPETKLPLLSGSNSKAYDEAVTGFIGGWESLEATLRINTQVRTDKSLVDQWKSVGRTYDLLSHHLRVTASFVSTALWNGDTVAVPRYCDALIRWLQPFYHELRDQYVFKRPSLILPGILTKPWNEASDDLKEYVPYRPNQIVPRTVLGAVLLEVHNDTVCLAGLVALHWYANERGMVELNRSAANQALKREMLSGQGSDLLERAGRNKTLFSQLVDLVVRYSFGSSHNDHSYSAEVESLIKAMLDAATPQMIPGRVYGGFVVEGFNRLRPVLLAALVANAPDSGDGGFTALTEALKADHRFLEDKTLRHFLYELEQLLHALETVKTSPEFKRATRFFVQDGVTEEKIAHLSGLFKSMHSSLSNMRAGRLRTAPLDDDRLNEVRNHVSKLMRDFGNSFPFFEPKIIQIAKKDVLVTQKFSFREMSRGLFTLPRMSDMDFSDIPGTVGEIFLDHLRHNVWKSLYRRPKRIAEIDIGSSTDNFWKRAVQEARTVVDPIILVPYEPLGNEVHSAVIGLDPERNAALQFVRDPEHESRDGAGYMGSIDGVPVYALNALRKESLICSRNFLSRISFGVIYSHNYLLDVELFGEDPEKSNVLITYSQRIEWQFGSLFEIRLTGVP